MFHWSQHHVQSGTCGSASKFQTLYGYLNFMLSDDALARFIFLNGEGMVGNYTEIVVKHLGFLIK